MNPYICKVQLAIRSQAYRDTLKNKRKDALIQGYPLNINILVYIAENFTLIGLLCQSDCRHAYRFAQAPGIRFPSWQSRLNCCGSRQQSDSHNVFEKIVNLFDHSLVRLQIDIFLPGISLPI